MDKETYVIVPVYNEAKVVGPVLKHMKTVFHNIICVNDGSKDTSAAEVEAAGVVLINHPVNLGAGAATQTGLLYALQDPEAQYFTTLDADGQHRPEDAKRMLAHLKKHNLDVVIGSRFIGQYENISRPKYILLKIAAIFSYATTGVKLTDPHIGLRVFNRAFAEALDLQMHDFAHASELVSRIHTGHFAYDEYPVKVTYTDYTKSKGQPMINAVNIAFDLLVQRLVKH